MGWDGVVGSVASVINTALPLLFGLLEEGDGDLKAGVSGAQPIGPATIYKDRNGVHQIGNFDDTQEPVFINFTSPQGDSSVNFSVQMNFGQSFAADEYLTQYTDGTVVIGLDDSPTAADGDANLLQGAYSYLTSTALTAGNTIQAIVNPSLSLNLNLRIQPNNQCVAIAAIGMVTALGMTYMLTCRNNAGQTGTRTGTLERDTSVTAEAGIENFTADLPTGIDYSQGIYSLQLQVPITLSPTSVASDPAVTFTTVDDRTIAEIRALLDA